jgi:hypothetical protein
MNRLIKISPYKKDFTGSPIKTQERSLVENGYVRTPGTKTVLSPMKQVDGRYRTGLDENAEYIKNLSPEEQEAEKLMIRSILKELREVYPDVDFGPRSKVWHVFSDEAIKTSFISLTNDDTVLNTTQIQDLLTYAWVRVHPQIAKSAEHIRTGKCKDCQYYIADDEAENRIQYAKNKLINKAIATFEDLSPTVKKEVARLMGLPVSDDSTEEAIYNLIDALLKTPQFSKGDKNEGRSTITVFNEIVALSNEDRHVRDLIEQAIRHNIYRMKGDAIIQGAEVISANKDEFVMHLLDAKNQKELKALEIMVRDKNKG